MANPLRLTKGEAIAGKLISGSDIDSVGEVNVGTDLEVADDFIQKCSAIKLGQEYDTRVSIPVDFSDEDLLTCMKLAHEKDITFNQFMEQALIAAIEKYSPDLVKTMK